ncbi:MAG: hypothetical protein AB1679_12150 [Actinomycetota bacterium]
MATRPTRKITARKPETPCQDHPSYDATNCPQCGTAAKITTPATAKSTGSRTSSPQQPADKEQEKAAASRSLPPTVAASYELKKQLHGRLSKELKEATVKATDEQAEERVLALLREDSSLTPAAISNALYWSVENGVRHSVGAAQLERAIEAARAKLTKPARTRRATAR